jgi:hypothetical protein
LFDTGERFRLDDATKDRLESLRCEMEPAYARHLNERLKPVCERYKRAFAGRSGLRDLPARNLTASPSCLPSEYFLRLNAKIANYLERHRWPFIIAYHRQACQEYGLTGLLWFMHSMPRGMRPQKLSAVILLMITRQDDPTPGATMHWIRRLYGEGLLVEPMTKRPGRRAIGPTAMTPAERQRRRRARLRETSDIPPVGLDQRLV